MRQTLRWALAAVTVLLVCALSPGLARDDKDEMVDNPLYTGWSSFKPGARTTVIEKTTHGDSSVEEREVVYKLVEVSPKRVIVQTSVIERDLLSRIETSPTRIHYPAKVKKADLDAALLESGAKKGKETIKVMGKDLECVTLEYSKKAKDDVITGKVWRSATIPGGLAKRVRTTKQDDKLVAETITTVSSYLTAPKAKKTD